MQLIEQINTLKGELTLWYKGLGYEIRLNDQPIPHWRNFRTEKDARSTWATYAAALLIK